MTPDPAKKLMSMPKDRQRPEANDQWNRRSRDVSRLSLAPGIYRRVPVRYE